jgi:hypothetical protein
MYKITTDDQLVGGHNYEYRENGGLLASAVV